ncbi:MAG: YaaA family protein [Planctomycetota bacterium]|nr:YaaA family protein [Planctomycetota bacterium]
MITLNNQEKGMAQREFRILIPPSEGKTPGGDGKPLRRARKPEKEMVERLSAFDGDWEKLLGVKGDAKDAAIEANQNLLRTATRPAIERYTGVVYQGIDYSSLRKPAKTFFDRHVRIVSAVFGLVEPQFCIPDYKLKIEKLDAAKYWRPLLAKELSNCLVVDLLPQAHRKAVAYEDGIEVEFYMEKSGKRKSAGHFGKLIKGKFVRWLCENRVKSVARFKEFEEDGYQWNGDFFLKMDQ